MSLIVEQKIYDLLQNLDAEGQPLLRFLSSARNVPPSDQVLYSGPYWDDAEIVAAISCLLTGKWLTSGEAVRKFEQEFCRMFNGKHAVMVNSGSSANLVMIGALKKRFGWRDGDEILVPVVGFPTTVTPIIQHGLKPVFVDIDPNDLNWSIPDLVSKMTQRTVAMFVSPTLGNPCDFDQLVKLAEANSHIKIVLDNCDSLGSKWREQYLSSYAVASSHSFYPAHHITTGEGGLVMSDDEEIIKIARSLAWWGRDCYCVGAANTLCNGTCKKRFDNWLPNYDGVVDHRYVFVNQGYNLKPLDLQGAIGSVQLKKFDDIHKKRVSHKRKIDTIISKNMPSLQLIGKNKHAETSWFGVPIICNSAKQKRQLVKHLEDCRIQTRNYFAGNLLLHPAFSYLGKSQDYPQSSIVLDRVFFIGCAPQYNVKDLQKIDAAFASFQEEK